MENAADQRLVCDKKCGEIASKQLCSAKTGLSFQWLDFCVLYYMQLYSKDDMLFQDYSWSTPSDSHKLKGTPDRNLFIPSDGNEILYMINHTAAACGLKTKEEASIIETLIHDRLPIDKWSQVNVERWLQKELESQSISRTA